MQTITLPTTGTYAIDPTHSNVEITARHMMVTKVRGNFEGVTGSIHVGSRPEESAVEVEFDAASIDTRVADRDAHLRSGDFLDVEHYPKISFTSTDVSHVDDSTFRLRGDLTVRGITKPIAFEFSYFGSDQDPWGQERALFEARTSFPREQWGLVWNAPLESGGVLVSKDFEVEMNISAVLQG
mgnify:CR=1 FL=1